MSTMNFGTFQNDEVSGRSGWLLEPGSTVGLRREPSLEPFETLWKGAGRELPQIQI